MALWWIILQKNRAFEIYWICIRHCIYALHLHVLYMIYMREYVGIGDTALTVMVSPNAKHHSEKDKKSNMQVGWEKFGSEIFSGCSVFEIRPNWPWRRYSSFPPTVFLEIFKGLGWNGPLSSVCEQDTQIRNLINITYPAMKRIWRKWKNEKCVSQLFFLLGSMKRPFLLKFHFIYETCCSFFFSGLQNFFVNNGRTSERKIRYG